MFDLYVNIKKRREDLKMSQAKLAELSGYADKTMISKIENGNVDLSQSKIVAIAKALKTTPRALMGWDDTLPDYSNIRPVTSRSFPVLGSVSCGEPILMTEERSVQVDSTDDFHADFVLIARGDSMTGARIHDGDVVFIRKQDTVDNGQIAVVAIDDEATLKRFYKYDDLIVLRAENPAYPDIEIRPEDGKQVHVLGLAIKFQGDVR